MVVQKTPSSWLMAEPAPWDEEIVVVTPRGGEEEIVVLDDYGEVALVSPNKQLQPEKAPKATEAPAAAAAPSIESIKMTLRGRTVVFYGMTKEEYAKECEVGFEELLEPVVQNDQIAYWCLKADRIPRLKELIGYYREKSQKISDLDAMAYADDIANGFNEPRDYLVEADFLPKLVRLTKGALHPCLHFEIIDRLSDYLHYSDLTHADVFCESEDEPLLAPPPAAVVETSAAEAIINFLETGEEPPFLSPGKEVFVALLALFKPLKDHLLQICTVEKLSEYLDEVDKNSEYSCPFQLPPEIQAKLTAFLTLYIKHRSTPLCAEEEPPSSIEIQARSLEQLQENAFAALEKVVHAANLNITIDFANKVVRLEKNGVSQDISHPESDDDLVYINQSDADSPYS